MKAFREFLEKDGVATLMKASGYGQPFEGADDHETWTRGDNQHDQFLIDYDGGEWHHEVDGDVLRVGQLKDSSLFQYFNTCDGASDVREHKHQHVSEMVRDQDEWIWLHSAQHGTVIKPTNSKLSHTDHMKQMGLPTIGKGYDYFERGNIYNTGTGRIHLSRSDGQNTEIPDDVVQRVKKMFPGKAIVLH